MPMNSILHIVKRSNQRGGRMLSVIDLIAADTLTREQVCWLLGRIYRGASWLVGAKPGGAGKTTIMSALLAMLPRDTTIHLTNPGAGWNKAGAEDCVVAYEISPGSYDAYIWGRDVARMAELGINGCRIVSNLHADTLREARAQIVRECGATEAGFAAFDLFLPVSLGRSGWSTARRVEKIDFFSDGSWQDVGRTPRLSQQEEAIGAFVDRCSDRNARTCEEVRAEWLAWSEREL